MSHDKIETKIKDLNAKRASLQRHLKDITKNYEEHKVAEPTFEKQKKKIELKIEKIKHQIRELEEKHSNN